MKSKSPRNWKKQLWSSPSFVPVCAHFLLLTFFLPGRGSQLSAFVLLWWVTLLLGKSLTFISGFPDFSLLRKDEGCNPCQLWSRLCSTDALLPFPTVLWQLLPTDSNLRDCWNRIFFCKDFMAQMVDWSQAQAETETTGPWTHPVTNEQMPSSCSWCTHPIKAS